MVVAVELRTAVALQRAFARNRSAASNGRQVRSTVARVKPLVTQLVDAAIVRGLAVPRWPFGRQALVLFNERQTYFPHLVTIFSALAVGISRALLGGCFNGSDRYGFLGPEAEAMKLMAVFSV